MHVLAFSPGFPGFFNCMNNNAFQAGNCILAYTLDSPVNFASIEHSMSLLHEQLDRQPAKDKAAPHICIHVSLHTQMLSFINYFCLQLAYGNLAEGTIKSSRAVTEVRSSMQGTRAPILTGIDVTISEYCKQ